MFLYSDTDVTCNTSRGLKTLLGYLKPSYKSIVSFLSPKLNCTMSKNSQRLKAHFQERQLQEATQKQLNKFYKENSLWDDLENIFSGCRDMIVNTMESVRQVLADKPLLAMVPQEQHVNFNNSVRAILADCDQFTTELMTIHARHENKSGRAINAEEASIGQLISSDYVAFSTRFKAVVDPVFAYIMEEAMKAEAQLKDAVAQGIALAQQDQAAEQAIDPNVVTDVVAKEVN